MKELYAGIDLHSNNLVLAVIDGEDAVMYRKRLPNELSDVLEALAPFRAQLKGVVVESTYNWYWLVDGLMDAGYRVYLANPAGNQQYTGLKYADDHSDATWLAKLLRLGVLAQGFIYPKEERPLRDLLRKRSQLVEQRTRNILSIQNVVTRNTGRRLSGNGVKRLSEGDVEELLRHPELALAAKSNVAVMKCVDEQIKTLEKAALKRIGSREDFQVLQTASGIGKVLGLTIALEVGDIRRFADVGDFASYSRCVGGDRFSNNKKKGRGNTKNGNRYLGWAFMEAAACAIQHDETIRRYYQRSQAKKKPIVARKIIAHKLARACYYMLRDGTTFDVGRAFGN
jgi:transposase